MMIKLTQIKKQVHSINIKNFSQKGENISEKLILKYWTSGSYFVDNFAFIYGRNDIMNDTFWKLVKSFEIL